MLTGAIFLGIYGFIAGVAFSLVLLVAERTRSLHQLTPRRVAAWGGLGGIVMAVAPVASTGLDVESGIFLLTSALLGAGSAAASLSVARRGLPAPPAMCRVETSTER